MEEDEITPSKELSAELDKLKATLTKRKEQAYRLIGRRLSERFDQITLDQALEMAISIGEEVCNDFRIDKNNISSYTRGVSWVLGRGEADIDPLKGLLILGPVGTGKSILIHVLWRLSQTLGATFLHSDTRRTKPSYRPLLWRERNASEFIDAYKGQAEEAYLLSPVLCINDLGTEVHARHYGKEVDVISELICWRADHGWHNYKLIATTNLSLSDIEEAYGSRVASRIIGYNNIIQLPGSDLRQV